MSYDIGFVPREGHGDGAPVTAGEASAAWDRIVRRITAEFGPVEVGPDSMFLNREWPAGYYTLEYDGESALLAIPYHFGGDAALPVMTEAYAVARIVEDEAGLESEDVQLGEPARGGDVAAAAASLAGTSDWLRRTYG